MGRRSTRRRCKRLDASIGSPRRGHPSATRPARHVVQEEENECSRDRSQSTDRRPGGRRGRRGRLLELGGRRPHRVRRRRAQRQRRRARGRAERKRGGQEYTIGYSNGGGVGNGFREEQVCTAKAEALASGEVSELTVIRRNTDAAGQLQDIRDLIAKGVNAIVFNPNDPTALNPALAEAKAAGIKTVVGRRLRHRPRHLQPVQQPGQVRRARRQVAVRAARRQGQRLLHARHRRPPGRHRPRHRASRTPSRTTRTSRSSRAAEGVATGWDPATATKLANEFIASGQYDTIQGIWTSGHRLARSSTPSRPPARSSCRSSAPTAARSSSSCSTRPAIPASTGAAVTNTAAVGGAGVNLALKLLNGETVETDPTADASPTPSS